MIASATRQQHGGNADPLLVGLTTFVEEFGSRAASLITLGGKAGIEKPSRAVA
jgi:hypothetical protein